ncbi:MAG: VOC family protein [Opitutaceae bacterium]
MIKITAFPYTGYPVTDLARARAFYENMLGLKTGDTWLEGDDRGWVEYEIGSGILAISNTSPEWKASGDGPSAALEVEDFDAAIAHLREHKVKFVVEPLDTPVCRMAVFQDPDGNALIAHKRNQK